MDERDDERRDGASVLSSEINRTIFFFGADKWKKGEREKRKEIVWLWRVCAAGLFTKLAAGSGCGGPGDGAEVVDTRRRCDPISCRRPIGWTSPHRQGPRDSGRAILDSRGRGNSAVQAVLGTRVSRSRGASCRAPFPAEATATPDVT
jgi:hypothetical protein